MSGAPMLSIHAAHVNCGRLGGGVKPPSICTLNFWSPCERNINAATTRSRKKKKSEYGPSSFFTFLAPSVLCARQDTPTRTAQLGEAPTFRIRDDDSPLT